MEPFTLLTGIAAPLPQANVDTDVIMPKQFLKGIDRNGLAQGLFYDLRFDEHGREREDFILNRPAYRSARFLVVGPNFGCGSSREHAVWGLKQFQIRGLIGTSFASIFRDNCFRNGLLLMELPPEQIEHVLAICSEPRHNTISVDLAATSIRLDGDVQINFDIDPLRRDDLLHGRDAIASTLELADSIAAFERDHWRARPWLQPPSLMRSSV